MARLSHWFKLTLQVKDADLVWSALGQFRPVSAVGVLLTAFSSTEANILTGDVKIYGDLPNNIYFGPL